MGIELTKTPFDEAIKYFQQKVKLPTEKWTDLWEGMHSRAFVVAGANRNEILTDFYTAVEKGIKDGTTLNDFRKDFDSIVSKNGWSYKGARGWRSATIFNTNLRVAYSAGNYKQMSDVLADRPYFRYIGGLSENPRPLHLSWSGIVLPADDAWWNSHYPPNGWGCKCKVVSASEREIKRDELKIADNAPENGSYQWKNPDTGEIINVPNGIDPGWAYNPGKTAWGENLSDKVMSEWKTQGKEAYAILTKGNWESEGRSGKIPLDKTDQKIDFNIEKSITGIETKLKEILGGDEKIYSFDSKNFRYDVLVNAKTLSNHIDINRAPYLNLLPETLNKPYEVWLSFEKHKGTGKVILRERIIKALDSEKGMLVVTNSVNGMMEAWTMISVNNLEYLNKQRYGRLIYKRN